MDLWLRRIHMYAALFLLPWVLMYALSTVVMNHREHLGGVEPEPSFETVLQRESRGAFPAGAPLNRIVDQLSDEFDVPGRQRSSEDPEDGTIVINGESPFGLRRVTYRPDEGMITVEAARYGVRRFLSQLHYRIGYQWKSPGERAWGFTVDLFAVTMLFWILSGLWMWWALRRTRRPGVVALGFGAGMFTLFLLTL